jgi:hypothetical protein
MSDNASQCYRDQWDEEERQEARKKAEARPRDLSDYPIDDLRKEILRREQMRTIHVCSTCHAPCGAGGCHGDGFDLKVTRHLAEKIAKIEFYGHEL